MLRLFGRSLKLRQVSAGGDGSTEADLNVLGTVVFDMGRFGIQFVASPRHADGLVVTGPVTENMRRALLKTYECDPRAQDRDRRRRRRRSRAACTAAVPKSTTASATCLPVDLYIPGSPPHPMTILDGLLRFSGASKPGRMRQPARRDPDLSMALPAERSMLERVANSSPLKRQEGPSCRGSSREESRPSAFRRSLAAVLADPSSSSETASRCLGFGLEYLGHPHGDRVELLGIGRCVGQIDVLGRDGRVGIDRHAHLVVVQAEHGVKDLDLPLGGTLDFLAEVEGRLGGVHADGDVDQCLAVARHARDDRAPRPP